MFKNRSIQIKLVKTPEVDVNADTVIKEPVDYEAIAKDAAKRLVIGTVVVIASTVVLKTLSQIAINALTPINE